MTRSRNIRLLWAGWALLLAASTLVSVLPGGRHAPGGWDASLSGAFQNAMHPVVYAGLAFWPGLALLRSGRGPAWLVLLALCLTAYGAGLEILQSFIPGRLGTFADTVSNALGSFLGVLAAWALRFRRNAATPSGTVS
jgi:VanZ family protein